MHTRWLLMHMVPLEQEVVTIIAAHLMATMHMSIRVVATIAKLLFKCTCLLTIETSVSIYNTPCVQVL